MTELDTIQTRTKRLMLAWIFICTTLLLCIYAIVMENGRLREELAKPSRLTMQQKSDVIKEYHANMTWETRYALRQFIGCTDKEAQ